MSRGGTTLRRGSRTGRRGRRTRAAARGRRAEGKRDRRQPEQVDGDSVQKQGGIDPEYIQQTSLANEKIVEKRFRQMNLRPVRLDDQGPRRRPDFLISDSSGPLLICEVKTIFSAGYLKDRDAHLSMADPRLLNSGVFGHPVDFSRMDEDLADSVGKYRCLCADEPALAKLPLTVAFFYDWFAEGLFHLYPRKMERFPEVSGILTIEADRAIQEAAMKMTQEELKARMESGSRAGLPANTKEFRLVENECARVRLPRQFVDTCVTHHRTPGSRPAAPGRSRWRPGKPLRVSFDCELCGRKVSCRIRGLEEPPEPSWLENAVESCRWDHWCAVHHVCAVCGGYAGREEREWVVHDGSITIHPQYTDNYLKVEQGDVGRMLTVHRRCVAPGRE